MTYLPAAVIGHWFYLYLILDVFSRKIVGFEVHERDDSVHAAVFLKRTALAEGVHALADKPVLHGDNGATLKATTVLTMLHWLGIKPSTRARGERRQRVRGESVPHREIPTRVPGAGLCRSGGGAGVGARLCALVQPRPSAQRHPLRQPGAASRGPGRPILADRHALYLAARERHPRRWSRHTRNWSPIEVVMRLVPH
jgi:hypothetical protein